MMRQYHFKGYEGEKIGDFPAITPWKLEPIFLPTNPFVRLINGLPLGIPN